MKKRLKKASIVLALAVLVQCMMFNLGFETIQAGAVGIINKDYWNYRNIGNANEYSTADVFTDKVIVAGSGSGVFNTEDSFTYSYIPVNGDCTIQARIVSESSTDALAKAGLMIRESLDTDSKNAFIALSKSNQIQYQYRAMTGGATASDASISGNAPVYLKLTRVGDSFEAFMSTDGTNWTKTGNTQTIAMGSKVYLGFASTSTDPNKLCTARFENIDIEYTDNTPPLAPTNLRVVYESQPSCQLAWDEASDDSGAVLYEIYSNGSLKRITHDCKSICPNIDFKNTVDLCVVAVDAKGNRSPENSTIKIVSQNALISSADVTNIRLNSIGLERMNTKRQQQNKPLVEADPVQVGEEIMTDSTPNNVIVQGNSVDLNTIYAESLPSSVDNSTLQCFPRIDNQIYGDCVIWSTGYYTMTHMVGLAKVNAGGQWDAKNDTTGSKVFSPKFAFSVGNAPSSTGLMTGVYKTYLDSGCATLADAPYINDGVDGFKLSTDLDSWENAINYRMDKYGYIDANENSLERIKQLLNNGYVMSFDTGTYNFMQYPNVVLDNPDPAVNDDYAVGKHFFYMVDGVNSGHQMTLVGYDDNIWWGDVNGDGIPQPEEKGLFKIANSWGSNYGYDGFVYVNYDSIYRNSQFSQFNSSTRMPIFKDVLEWMTPRRDYVPQLIAEFTVSHAKADQLRIAVGYSDMDKNMPEAYFFPGSLNYLSHTEPFDFNVDGTACDGNFAVDMTDFITKFNLDKSKRYKWYLMVGDNEEDGSPVTLKSFRVHDKINNKYSTYRGPELQNDGDNSYVSVDYSWALVGDVDGNGIIDDADQLLIVDYSLGYINDFPVEDDMWAADVNGDGIINMIDSAFIRKYILGQINIFPKQQLN
ncbi:dockerin type I domain-containing protein [Ruminiclostridium cellulolyticum]|uniref:cellulase n=1 Tax=Ruminiclostridium cellulolyticum (strain ATCC 35319 / DSM 5812 / JCM 6584 / H10) TaxID=394503 RepID=B8I606_RUMCH|nr:dockerin type I domain-containing protein [Ruminiclostridium cellulolyticum]ACL76771.1 cellulosome protein dockerin type I [Ruminiclostridium cellulolyticum H10]